MIGLFFGDTEFPKQVLKKIKHNKMRYLIMDLSKNKIFKKDPYCQSIGIGQFGKIFNYLKKKNCKQILFAGKINKPKFSTLKLDFKGIYYLPKILKAAKLGDAAILKTIINILAMEKIKVISSIKYNPELTLSKGLFTKTKPNKNDIISINNGIKSLKRVDPNNHVQGLIVQNSNVIAHETIKGTKIMLESIKKFKDSQAILIKFPKKKQDLRIDLPTIGFDTLKDCKRAGIKGIVLKSKQHIFMDKSKSLIFANKHKIFITVQ
tara:strand:- start:2458 stop:3249 length:792 start_codon:yes stop_codon:yes gene_type:complete